MSTSSESTPWNKGKLIGQKLPLKLKEIWAIRVRLQLANNKRDLAFSIWRLIASFAEVIGKNQSE